MNLNEENINSWVNDTENAEWGSVTKSADEITIDAEMRSAFGQNATKAKAAKGGCYTGKEILDFENPVKHYELKTDYMYRRAFSESRLLDTMGIEPLKEGYSYHFLTSGDVDGLSYLKIILRHHSLDYLLLSTWAMNVNDVKQIDLWMEEGKIRYCDAYVGEIYPQRYPVEWRMLNEMFGFGKNGSVTCFKNHSKIFAGYNEKEGFGFAIESSANINTNPRTEQAVITIDRGLADFYIEQFGKIRDAKRRRIK